MMHRILLVSQDTELAERLRRALPAAVATELHCAPQYEPSSDRRGWLLVLWDGAVAPPESADGRGTVSAAEPVPVLWVAQPPHLTRAGLRPGALPGPVVDFLRYNEPASKLAFILAQHLSAAYLRRMRALTPSVWTPRPGVNRPRLVPAFGPAASTGALRSPAQADPATSRLEPAAALAPSADAAADEDVWVRRQRELNNALTGILGNAELAMESGRRLPTALVHRLVRIVELAEHMREAMAAPPWGEAGAEGLTGTGSRAA